MAKAFALIYHQKYYSELKCTGIADDIEAVITQWVDPHVGYLPDHIENTAERMDSDEELTDEEAKAFWEKDHPKHTEAREKVTTEALRCTRLRFGIGCEPDRDRFSDDWIIVEIDCETGRSREYSQN